MPIFTADLCVGDILFKKASSSAISKAIAKGQMGHYKATVKKVGTVEGITAEQAVKITHVAMAAGPDDVLEFDEGGASKSEIVLRRGHGFVRGPMSLASRKGKQYEVYRCLHPELAKAAADKAALIWDLSHQVGGKISASYGLANMLKTALFHRKGEAASSAAYFEKALDAWVRSSTGGFFSSPVDLQFFCSEFVAFCYMWAAAETGIGRMFGAGYLLGTEKYRMSPVEMYMRVVTTGKGSFTLRGPLYNG
ncbi:MAG: hypothetical protein V4505_15535 [Pseudomonadota bacterium]